MRTRPNASGDCVAVMDCDLQHPPETLITMYRLWEQGYQVIEGVKASRRATPSQIFSPKHFIRS